MTFPPTKFNLKQIVYLRINPELTGMVLQIAFTADGGVLYRVSWSDSSENNHYECELTDEKSYTT